MSKNKKAKWVNKRTNIKDNLVVKARSSIDTQSSINKLNLPAKKGGKRLKKYFDQLSGARSTQKLVVIHNKWGSKIAFQMVGNQMIQTF